MWENCRTHDKALKLVISCSYALPLCGLSHLRERGGREREREGERCGREMWERDVGERSLSPGRERWEREGERCGREISLPWEREGERCGRERWERDLSPLGERGRERERDVGERSLSPGREREREVGERSLSPGREREREGERGGREISLPWEREGGEMGKEVVEGGYHY